MSMVKVVTEATLPAGSSIRIGVPAEQPEDAIAALRKVFFENDNVISARLGLMEILHPNGPSEFTYTIGIQCEPDEQDIITTALDALQSVSAGRWPISICPLTSQFFTPEAIVFFRKK